MATKKKSDAALEAAEPAAPKKVRTVKAAAKGATKRKDAGAAEDSHEEAPARKSAANSKAVAKPAKAVEKPKAEPAARSPRAKAAANPPETETAVEAPKRAAKAKTDGDAEAPKRKRTTKAAAEAPAEPAATDEVEALPAEEVPESVKPKRAAKAKAESAETEPVQKKAPAATTEPAPKRTPLLLPVVAAAPAPAKPLFPSTEYAVVEKILVAFLAHEVRKVGLSKAVLGLSGGVDSAVSAAVAARALGPENVLGVMMPYSSSSQESVTDAEAVAASLGIETLLVDITPQVDSYFARFPDASRLRRGNKMARERMTILYDHSAARSALVVGTSNKTELLLGYGTLYGDMASALNPIGDLYKTQVWGLARHLGLPAAVIDKAPTADLWSGQTDEHELGFSYHEVDALLYRLIDERCSRDELVGLGFDAAFVDRIAGMVRASQFKRRLPVIAKVSSRSIDTDFRYSRDWGL